MTAEVSSSIVSDSTSNRKTKSDIDCEQCGLVKSKYSCPKCGFRSCSVGCVKLHKESNNCNGERPNFEPVKKGSEYNDEISIKDKLFLTSVTEAVVTGVKRARDVQEPTVVKDKIRKVEEKAPKVLEEAKVDNNEQNSDGKKEEVNMVGEANVNDDVDDNLLTIDDVDEEIDGVTDTANSTVTLPLEANSIQSSESSEIVKSDEKVVNNDEECDFVKKYTATIENGFGEGLSKIERDLITNVLRRRIYISIKNTSEAAGSSFEPISNTIFWTIDLHFLREIKNQPLSEDTTEYVLDSTGEQTEVVDGYTVIKGSSVIDYKKEARFIPESIKVSTLLKQYLQPKKIGVVVSKKDLDETSMQPFWDAGIDNVQVFMKVEEGENERYYHIAKDKPILMNLRNRFIRGHPRFIVVLSDEFKYWQQLSEMEAQELNDIRSKKHKEERQQSDRDSGRNRRRDGRNNHRGRGDRGGFRGGRGRGGGGRGRFDDRRQHDRRGGGRGRGGFGNRRGGRNDGNEFDLDYIFSGGFDYRVERPNVSSNENDTGLSGWANAVTKRYQDPQPPSEQK